MGDIDALKGKVFRGEPVTASEALRLKDAPLDSLRAAADDIRRHFRGEAFDMCCIINGKSGRCSENCKFCAQSAFYHTGAGEYPLLEAEKILADALDKAGRGVPRYSIVTSGKRLSDREVEEMCGTIARIRRETGMQVCVSFGLLGRQQFDKLKAAGATRVHNNLETSRRYFPQVCTTHSFEEKTAAIKAAQDAGLEVCSGGIVGLGETWEDRIDMALTLRKLGIRSVPVNLLSPIPGTPFEENQRVTEEELERVVAVFRFLLPDAFIRLAGGRGLMQDKGAGCFRSGANAAITGDMLTTAGYTVESDRKMLEELGYSVTMSQKECPAY